MNGARRQLKHSQLTAIAVKMLPALEEEARKRQINGKGADGSGGRGRAKNLTAELREGFPARAPTAAQHAAKIVGVGARSVNLLP